METQRETATAVVLIVMSVVMFAVWAAAEFKAKTRDRAESDRDALAISLDVLRDRLDPEVKAAFADAVAESLRDPEERLAEVRHLFATYPDGGGAA